MSHSQNRRIVLASRPVGAPRPEDFRLEHTAIPTPGAGEMLLQTLWLSLDPYMRGRMSDAKSYAKSVAIDEVMVGGTVARVVASNIARYKAGDIVLSYGGWQDYALSDGAGIQLLDPARAPVQTALGVLGMPGMTAYCGLRNIGLPKAGETLVVAEGPGKTANWSFEMSSATQIQKLGWTPEIIKPGDKVTVTYFPLRFGSYGGQVVSVKLADGRVLKGVAEPDRGYPKP